MCGLLQLALNITIKTNQGNYDFEKTNQNLDFKNLNCTQQYPLYSSPMVTFRLQVHRIRLILGSPLPHSKLIHSSTYTTYDNKLFYS